MTLPSGNLRDELLDIYRGIARLQPSLAEFVNADAVVKALEDGDFQALVNLGVCDRPDPDAPERTWDAWLDWQSFIVIPIGLIAEMPIPANDPCFRVV